MISTTFPYQKKRQLVLGMAVMTDDSHVPQATFCISILDRGAKGCAMERFRQYSPKYSSFLLCCTLYGIQTVNTQSMSIEIDRV
jgi:hypothetical protein